MTRLVGVFGASGYGREVMPLVEDANALFIDDNRAGLAVNGRATLTWAQFLDRPADARTVVIAVSDSRARQAIAERCDAAGVPLLQVAAKNVVMMENNQFGDGAILSPFVTITSNVRIGRCFQANLYAYAGHEAVIGDYVTLAPRASINGNVRLGNHVYVGTGALIRQGITVGDGAVIGMGAVVTKDVPAGVTVVGNPARAMDRR